MEMAEGKPRKLKLILTAGYVLICELNVRVCINIVCYVVLLLILYNTVIINSHLAVYSLSVMCIFLLPQ